MVDAVVEHHDAAMAIGRRVPRGFVVERVSTKAAGKYAPSGRNLHARHRAPVNVPPPISSTSSPSVMRTGLEQSAVLDIAASWIGIVPRAAHANRIALAPPARMKGWPRMTAHLLIKWFADSLCAGKAACADNAAAGLRGSPAAKFLAAT